MSNEIKKLKIERNERKKRLSEIYYLTGQIEYFLRHYGRLFKKDDSVRALEKIRKFNEVNRKEAIEIYKNLSELENKLTQVCRHEVLVHLDGGNFWCPICELELLNIRKWQETTKYFIDGQFADSKKVKAMVAEIINTAIESDNGMMGEVEAGLGELQYVDNVKVLRRWHS